MSRLALDRHQRRALSEAIGDAFTVVRLRQMLDWRLDRRLDDITLADDYQSIRFDLIQGAEAEGWTAELLVGAREENPGNPRLLAFAQEVGLTTGGLAVERIVREQSPYFDVELFRRGLGEVEGRVCRIEIRMQCGTTYGTGFLVAKDQVMTNHHVVAALLHDTASPGDATFLFDFKKIGPLQVSGGTPYTLAEDWRVADSPLSPLDLEADPKSAVPPDDELDFAIVRLAKPAGAEPIGSGGDSSPDRGWIKLADPQAAPAPNSPLMVVQHPKWTPLKLALEMDGVMAHDGPASRIRHRVNTEPGSSGSPCFNIDWELVGLHHVGDPDMSAPAQFNEAIAVGAIIDQLRAMGSVEALAGAA